MYTRRFAEAGCVVQPPSLPSKAGRLTGRFRAAAAHACPTLDDIWTRVRDELRARSPTSPSTSGSSRSSWPAREQRDALRAGPGPHPHLGRATATCPLIRAAAERGWRAGAAVEIVDGRLGAPRSGRPRGRRPRCRLNPKYTFEQFVIGDGNRFAHAAALAVAELPGQAYNPLFIHGRPGLGKTHLLHADRQLRRALQPRAQPVRYATVEEFTTEFVAAVRARDTSAFKERFRGADVLLLDDVQFLADKARTEEELFHTFNALRDAGRQLVMTCDRSPDELDGLEERLAERFGSGLVVSVEPPDLHVRRAILEKRARLDAVDAGPELLDEIAGTGRQQRPRPRGRADPGRGLRLAARRGRHARPGAPAAQAPAPQPRPIRPARVAAVVDATASQFGVSPEELLARDRRPQVARARQVAMYLARELTDESLPEIGRGFGGRDHTTVHSARAQRRRRGRASDPELARLWKA